MSTERLFLTFTHLTDMTRHAEYNAWHQLDHLPENELLPGVAWGDRWVRTPGCAAAGHVGDTAFAPVQYAVAYGFQAPLEPALQAWTDLNQRALWWGRRPELAWTERRPVGFFHPVKEYAAARVLVSPAAIPHRPHRGVHLTLSRTAAPSVPAGAAYFAALDRDLIPAMLAIPGVAGAATYRFAEGAGVFGSPATGGESDLVVRILYLDGDVLETSARIEDEQPDWIGRASAPGDVEHVLLSTPMLSIRPWEWDWFEGR
ncbi:hypothetical protein ABZS66_38745 [Dactylosporangium sp. NPDC005572]|uniref:hypothetical protein n=1 Tax=Dactylosporangium sp. NPDC005572 TaxID=3156889 RepID=UPI0033B87341